jgi:hypothetical protein
MGRNGYKPEPAYTADALQVLPGGTAGAQETAVVPRVKFFVNDDDLHAEAFVRQLAEADVQFSVVPTSGPLTICVDGAASFGPTAVQRAIRLLTAGASKP